MVGRVFLILVGGVFASGTLTFILADNARLADISHIRSLHTAEKVEHLVLMLEAIPLKSRGSVAVAASHNGIAAEISSAKVGGGEPDVELNEALHQRLGKDRHIDAKKVACPVTLQVSDDLLQRGQQSVCRTISISLQDGTLLHLALQHRRPLPAGPPLSQLLSYLFFFSVCLGLLAYGVARMSVQPLRKLAKAAIELGRNIEQPPLVEHGPTEVRDAAAAFNTMQAKIRRYIQERTQMLAAITHDLQTPLTRIRLRLEKVQDAELKARLIDDLSAVQTMIKDGLDLARSMNSEDPMRRTDFDSILSSLCADAVEAGQDVTLSGLTEVSIAVQPNAIQRCLTNLIDNAVKYGGYARITARRNKDKVIVQIRDGGPGIPEGMLESVFEPFFRLEVSRSRDTGGTGIGVTIARNIAEKHGGTLLLRNHPEGGLEATLELPVNS